MWMFFARLNLGFVLLLSILANIVLLLWNRGLIFGGPRKRESGLHERPFFWAVVLGVAAIGTVLLILALHRPDPLKEFLSAFGHAFLIAAILAATVDLYLKRRLVREVSLDASKFLIGYELPVEMKDRIKSLISTPLIRKDVELRYRIVPQEDPEYVTVFLDVAFDLDNLSHRAQPYQQEATSFDNYQAEEPVFLQLRCDATLNEECYSISRDQIPAVERNSGTVKGKPLKIPPHNRAHGRRYRVGALYSSKKRREDEDFFIFLAPSIGVTVTVECPHDLMATLEPKADVEHANRWYYSRLWDENEILFLRWVEKLPASTNHTQASKRSVMGALQSVWATVTRWLLKEPPRGKNAS